VSNQDHRAGRRVVESGTLAPTPAARSVVAASFAACAGAGGAGGAIRFLRRNPWPRSFGFQALK
jgi:hypothetical protein